MKLLEQIATWADAFVLLNEANVANIKEPIGSEITVQSYLQHYANNLQDPQLKAGFIKKLATLLVNGDTNLAPLNPQALPNDAPAWAVQAAQNGQLFVFQPDAALNDKISHISHYLSAAEQDTQSQDNNQKAFAVGEIKGFGKVGTLDLLVTKSQEYFKRGSRNQKREADGMKQVLEVKGGFVWYLLESQDAYKREGKILQNCIGTHYTAEKAKQTNTMIFILRDAQNDSVAAARVVGNRESYQLEELKGKQNRPPVKKYMAPSIEFLNKMKFAISTSAQNELINAGYVYHEGTYYEVEDAVRNFTETKEIAAIGDSLKLVMVTKVLGSRELRNQLYHNSNDTIFEVRDKNNTVQVTMFVNNGIMYGLVGPGVEQRMSNRYGQQAIVKGAVAKDLLNDAVQPLLKAHHITDFSSQFLSEVHFKLGLTFAEQQQKFEKIDPTAKHKDEEHSSEWHEHTSPDFIRQIKSAVYDDEFKNAKVDAVFTKPDDDFIYFLIDKTIYPVPLKERYSSFGGYGATPPNEVKSLIKFASARGYDINPQVKRRWNLLRETESNRIFIATEQELSKLAKQIGKDGKTYKFDLSGLGKSDRINIAHIANSVLRLGFEDLGPDFAKQNENSDETPNNELYLVELPTKEGAAKNRIGVLVKDSEIVRIGSDSSIVPSDVVTTLNAFAKQFNLTFVGRATPRSLKEYIRVLTGRLITKTDLFQQRMERGAKKNANQQSVTIPYEDGSVLEKFSVEMAAQILRKQPALASQNTQVWGVKDDSGSYKYIFILKGNNVKQVLHVGRDGNYVHGYTQELLRYLSTAAKTLKWKADHPSLQIEPGGVMHEQLKSISAGERGGKYKAYHNIANEIAVQRAIRFGLAKRVIIDNEDEFDNFYYVKLTDQGREILWKLNNAKEGETIDGWTHIQGKPLEDGFELPKEPEKVAAQAAEPETRPVRQPREGGQTKASMAVDKFKEFQEEHGRMPTAAEFKQILKADPFNMSDAAAQTYYYTTKKKIGEQLGEGSFLWLAYNDELIEESTSFSLLFKLTGESNEG